MGPAQTAFTFSSDMQQPVYTSENVNNLIRFATEAQMLQRQSLQIITNNKLKISKRKTKRKVIIMQQVHYTLK